MTYDPRARRSLAASMTKGRAEESKAVLRLIVIDGDRSFRQWA
jgi:hypothetical protein